jgi:4-hydroxybenzoate polyprenyltransferase
MRWLLDLLFRYRLYLAPGTFVLGLIWFPEAAFKTGDAYKLSACFTALITAVYLLNKVTDLDEDERNPFAEEISRSAVKPLLVSYFVLTLVPAIYLWFAWRDHLWLYLAIAVLGIWYSARLPVLGFRLKEVLVVKNLTSAISWAAIATCVPALWKGSLTARDLAFYVEVGCTIMIGELLWDVRDVEGDRMVGTRTVANVWGLGVTKALCVAVLALGIGMSYIRGVTEPTYIPVVMGSLALILLASPTRKPSFYHAYALLWVTNISVYLSHWPS